jgi:hypothetical protein
MLNNKIKSIVSICVIGSMFLTGCSTESLEDRVNNYDDRYYEAAELICRATSGDPSYLTDYNATEKLELFEKYNTNLTNLQTELDVEMKEYKPDSTEYKMFESLDDAASEINNAYNLVEQNIVENPNEDTNEATSFALGLALCTFIDNADKDYKLFNQYKNELGIETTNPKEPLPNTLNDLRNELNNLGLINVPETQQQTTNKEETKAEPKEGTITQGTGEARLCHDCGIEIEAGNNTNLCDHCLLYDNCSDCGKERLKEDMTFKDTKYHCGCADQTFDCAYCGKTTTLDNCVGASYCSNECLDAGMMISCAGCGKSVDPFETAEYNEHEYCYECYNSIMNDTFGGPASVPEE